MEIPTNTPVPPPPDLLELGATITLKLNEDTLFENGQTGQLGDTGITISLVESSGPAPDCRDCPNSATIVVAYAGESQSFDYSLSGNMQLEVMEKARRKTAFGYTFIAIKIVEGAFTLRVEPNG
jgi:hypothetical protein